MFKRKRISLDDARRGYDIFQMIPIQYVDIDMERVLQLSHSLNIYAYDAYFLDCCQRHGGTLLSLDDKLLGKALKLGLKTLEI